MTSNSSYSTHTQSVAIIKALYKLFLSGVGNNATYAADPVCGAFVTAAGINVEAYGNDDIYPITDIDANNFFVTTPNYKVRCSITSGTKPYVMVIPYVNIPVHYNSTTKTVSNTVTLSDTTNTINYYTTHAPAAGLPIDLSIFFGDSTCAFGDSTGPLYLYVQLYKKVGNYFIRAALSANANSRLTFGVTPYILTENTTDKPVPVSFGTNFGLMQTALSGNTVATLAVLPGNTAPPSMLSDPTTKPVMKMKMFTPDFESDLSSDGIFLCTLSLAAEFAATVTNMGTTYRNIGGLLLVAT